MASLCDVCARPGVCCSGFVLGTDALRDGAAAEVDALLAAAVTCTDAAGRGSFLAGRGEDDLARVRADPRLANARLGLPFRRLYRAPDGRWRYWCPHLRRDGRCGDYPNRPAACRALQPGESLPCCHHVAKIGACIERTMLPFHRKN